MCTATSWVDILLSSVRLKRGQSVWEYKQLRLWVLCNAYQISMLLYHGCNTGNFSRKNEHTNVLVLWLPSFCGVLKYSGVYVHIQSANYNQWYAWNIRYALGVKSHKVAKNLMQWPNILLYKTKYTAFWCTQRKTSWANIATVNGGAIFLRIILNILS